VSALRRLLLSPRAAADLEDIAEYIARDNPERAASFIEELEAACSAVAATPPSTRRARTSPLACAWRCMAVTWCCSASCRARTGCALSACCTAPATSRACSSRWRFGASGRCQARPSDGAGQIRQARDLSHRSGQLIHQRRLHRPAAVPPHRHQHGRARRMAGQRVCRSALALGEIRAPCRSIFPVVWARIPAVRLQR
jgi:plasmid stabilization system protein ParE